MVNQPLITPNTEKASPNNAARFILMAHCLLQYRGLIRHHRVQPTPFRKVVSPVALAPTSN
jgi:hypothetical protein